MRVALYEDNLMWSARLKRAAEALGHDVEVVDMPREPTGSTDLAVIDFASTRLDPAQLAARLRAAGVRVVGHAGHKEADLLDAGRAAGCTLMVTNRMVAEQLGRVIQQALEQPE